MKSVIFLQCSGTGGKCGQSTLYGTYKIENYDIKQRLLCEKEFLQHDLNDINIQIL